MIGSEVILGVLQRSGVERSLTGTKHVVVEDSETLRRPFWIETPQCWISCFLPSYSGRCVSLLTAEYGGIACRFDNLLDATVNSICPAVRNSVSLVFLFP